MAVERRAHHAGLSRFLAEVRVLIVTGKGGAGKTTVAAVMANLGARAGLRALVVQLAAPGARREPESAHLAHLFGREEVLDWDSLLLSPGADGGEVSARALRADKALVEYLHLHGMRRLSRRLVSSGALDVVATAVPGMPDMLVLGKLKQMERAAAAGLPEAPELILLDAPAAGHAIRFLQSPRGLLDAAAAGPIRSQAREVVDMLGDPSRCQVLLVTTPEETPVTETVETAQLLKDRVGATVRAVVVNGRVPPLTLPLAGDAASLVPLAAGAGLAMDDAELEELAAAGQLRLRRQQTEAAQVARLARELPLPQLEVPFCFSADLGPEQLGALTDALAASVDAWEVAPT